MADVGFIRRTRLQHEVGHTGAPDSPARAWEKPESGIRCVLSVLTGGCCSLSMLTAYVYLSRFSEGGCPMSHKIAFSTSRCFDMRLIQRLGLRTGTGGTVRYFQGR